MKVIYWLIVGVIVLALLFNRGDYYAPYPTAGWGVLLGLLSFLGYLALRRIVAYVFNSEQKS